MERFGWFTSLWFALLTRPLPFHRQIWEIGPYLFALGSVALMAWASWRLAGRWAAAMTATAAVATSPIVSYSRVTLNFHTATWVATVVLAVFAIWLVQNPRRDHASFAAVLVTALAGATLASDRLFVFVGLIPFALTGLLVVFVLRARLQGAIVLASAACAVPIAWATSWVMTASNVEVFPSPTRFAEGTELWPNFGRLLKAIVGLANGDYFFDAELGVRSVLSFTCALLVLLALAAPFVLVRRELRSTTPTRPLLVYAGFWAASLTLSSASYVVSSEGTHPGHYFTRSSTQWRQPFHWRSPGARAVDCSPGWESPSSRRPAWSISRTRGPSWSAACHRWRRWRIRSWTSPSRTTRWSGTRTTGTPRA